MTRIVAACLTLGLAASLSGASDLEDRIRSTCRWVDSEAAFPTSLLTRITASDNKGSPADGVSGQCAIVLECLLEARSGQGKKEDAGSTNSAPVDPASLCWRVAEIEKLPKETIDRMQEHLERLASGAARKKGDDLDAASCGRFLKCLSRSGIGTTDDRSWREEFARICAMTDVADTLSHEELQALVDDSEKLLRVLETLAEREAKVYIFRIKMCRDLFAYSLQLLEAEAAQPD